MKALPACMLPPTGCCARQAEGISIVSALPLPALLQELAIFLFFYIVAC